MIFPVIYAALTWYFAMRWRREWPSFLAVGLSGLLLALAIRMIGAWREHIPDEALGGLVLLYPYSALVVGVGLYICCMPRRVTETQCRRCRYDLAGLDPINLRCPECGTLWKGRGSGLEEKEEWVPRPKGPIKRRGIG